MKLSATLTAVHITAVIAGFPNICSELPSPAKAGEQVPIQLVPSIVSLYGIFWSEAGSITCHRCSARHFLYLTMMISRPCSLFSRRPTAPALKLPPRLHYLHGYQTGVPTCGGQPSISCLLLRLSMLTALKGLHRPGQVLMLSSYNNPGSRKRPVRRGMERAARYTEL